MLKESVALVKILTAILPALILVDLFVLVQYHPDKNPAPDAEEKFKEIRYVSNDFGFNHEE